MNKTTKTTILSAVFAMASIGVFANPVAIGTLEPSAVDPSVTGYNSVAIGANTVVNGTNTIVLGRDNTINGDNNIVLGGGNGTTSANQSSVIGYNNYIGNHVEQTVIGANNTVDNQGSIAIGTHSVVRGIDAVVIGNNASAPVQNSVAIGTNSETSDAVAFGQMNINGVTHVFAGERPNSSVSFGSKQSSTYSSIHNYNRQLQNVSAGRITADSLDAVNGSQLYAAIDEITSNGNKISGLKSRVDNHDQHLALLQNGFQDQVQQINDLQTTTRDINTTLGSTVAQVNVNTKDISDLKGKVGISSALKQQVQTNTADIRANEHAILDYEQRITTLESQNKAAFGALENKVNQLERGTNQAIASVSALSALHWNGFDAHNKLSFSAGFGHYKNANAGALGAFYAPNENVMFYVGQSFGSSSVTNASVNFKVGKTTNVKRDELKELKERVEMLENLLSK